MKKKKRLSDQLLYCDKWYSEMQGCVGCQTTIIAKNQGRKLNRY